MAPFKGNKTGAPDNGYMHRVLVVDDDPDIAEIISTALVPLGLEVHSATTYQEAILLFDRFHIDVVISDFKMPGMDGIELVTRFRESDPHLSSILMTGYGTTEIVIDAFTRGKINYYLSKPFKLNKLMEVVSAAVNDRKIGLSEKQFRNRLENEIKEATRELERSNRLLQREHKKTQHLYEELQTRQEEIERTKSYLEDLLKSSVDGIISTDANGRISFFSGGAKEMLGYSEKVITKKSMAKLFPSRSRAFSRLLEQVNRNERIKHFETRMTKADGEEMVVDISASRIISDPEGQGYLFIIKDIGEQKRLEEELKSSNTVLERLSVTDGLTNLYNHRHFQKCLSEEFKRAKRYQGALSLIMLDLDDFKKVNDTFGHQAGDEVLIHLSELIRESVRDVDTAARYGGEEFTIILPETDVDHAVLVAKRLKESIETTDRFTNISKDLNITASIGVSGYPEFGTYSPEDLIRYADKALLRAKEIGKNRIVIGTSLEQRPLGKGEFLTPAEKKTVLRRVSNTMRGTLDLHEILDYLLEEISAALSHVDTTPHCAIYLMDKNHGLRAAADNGVKNDRRLDMEIVALQTLETRFIQVRREGESNGPMISYPILIQWPDRGEEIVGTINICTVPPDLDFFRDLTSQAALGIVNAKLYHEVAMSRTSLEKRVNQLMSLSLMGMGLQRNAANFNNHQPENQKLIARSLAKVGFDKVMVFRYDRRRNCLTNGVDNSLRGEMTPTQVDLMNLEDHSRIGMLLNLNHEENNSRGRVVFFHPSDSDFTAGESNLLKKLGLTGSTLGMANLVDREKIWGLVIVGKEIFTEEDSEVLSTFALQASLIMENLNLSRLYLDKADRLTMLHGIARNLGDAPALGHPGAAIQNALQSLTDVLKVSEISLYRYLGGQASFQLLAYTSDTAGPGKRPVEITHPKLSPIMGMVQEMVVDNRTTAPLLVNDLKTQLGRRLRKRFSTMSYMGLPILGGGRFLGIMNVTDKLDKSEFTADDAELAQIIAGILGSILFFSSFVNNIEDRILDALSLFSDLMMEKVPPPNRKSIPKMISLAASLSRATGHSNNETNWMLIEFRLGQLKDIERGLEISDPDDQLLRLSRRIHDWVDQIRAFYFSFPDPTADAIETKFPVSTLANRILPIVEYFIWNFLELKPKDRPKISELVFDMIRIADEQLDREMLEAFVRHLIRGNLKSGRGKIKVDNDEWIVLTNHLVKESRRRRPGDVPKMLALHFLQVIREERSVTSDTAKTSNRTKDPTQYGK